MAAATAAIALLAGCGGDDDSTETERALGKLERASGAPPAASRPEGTDDQPGTSDGSAGAEALIRRYFAFIDRDEFVQAWSYLDPSVQESFGGFESWRDGYASNVSTQVGEVEPTGHSGGDVSATVRINAVDACDGERYEQEFEGPWSVDTGRGRITSADFALISGSPPPSSCLG